MHSPYKIRLSDQPTAREIALKMCKQQRLLRVLANGVGASERARDDDVVVDGTAEGADRRRRHGKIGENAPWLQNIIITAAARWAGEQAGRQDKCLRAATKVVRKT